MGSTLKNLSDLDLDKKKKITLINFRKYIVKLKKKTGILNPINKP